MRLCHFGHPWTQKHEIQAPSAHNSCLDNARRRASICLRMRGEPAGVSRVLGSLCCIRRHRINSRTVTVKEGTYPEQMRAVRISLDEIFRGLEGPEVEILTGFRGGDCG